MTALKIRMVMGLALAGSASAAWGFGLNDPHGPLRHLPQSGRDYTFHSLNYGKKVSPALPKGFSLFQRGALSLTDTVQSLLYGEIEHPGIEVRTTPDASGYGLDTGSHSVHVQYFAGGVPLCRFAARATALADMSLVLLANVPDVAYTSAVPSRDEWPDAKEAAEAALEAVAELATSDGLALDGTNGLRQASAPTPCIQVRNGQLVPAWSYTIFANGLPYRALSVGHDAYAEPGYFSVDGTAKVFERNPLSALVDVSLPGLVGDGKLVSEFLKTVVPSSYESAVAANHQFVFDPNSAAQAEKDKFAETQAYSAVTRHHEFTKTVGFNWYGPKPLEVRLHVKPGGRSNNALFVPGSTVDNSPPTISIDDGDGIDLQFLALDYDVIAHEFGHHVVYEKLKSTTGQSLALHEGLADALAFFATNDPCLGESICPANSNACIVKGQCLRTAALDLKYGDQTWTTWAGTRNRLGHLHGQLISGLMWDLKATYGVPADVVPKLIVKAVSFFKDSSTFGDFLVALYAADKELYAGQYTATIRTAADARGMTLFLEGGGPTDNIVSTTGTGVGTGTGSAGKPEKKETKGDENPLRCGTIAYGSDASPAILALMLLTPLVFLLVRRPQPVPAKRKARPRGR